MVIQLCFENEKNLFWNLFLIFLFQDDFFKSHFFPDDYLKMTSSLHLWPDVKSMTVGTFSHAYAETQLTIILVDGLEFCFY